MAVSDLDFAAIQAFAVDLAKKAGKQIKDASDKRWKASAGPTSDGSKKNSVDLVTETDQAVEEFVIESIEKTYPSHKFIGEESYAAGKQPDLTDEPTWICDPIDGTTNFVHGFPMVCISIGFVVDKVPVIGVIYNPFLDQLYSARKGNGATCNGVRLPYSSPNPPPLADLGGALIASEWGSDRSRKVMEMKSSNYVKLAGDGKEIDQAVMCHSLRSLGSAALNYGYVASGQLDLYHEIGCWSWDVCAGVVVAREAGGRCYGRGGRPFDGEVLMGHHFFVIRAIGDTAQEKGSDAQERLAKDFFGRVQEWDA